MMKKIIVLGFILMNIVDAASTMRWEDIERKAHGQTIEFRIWLGSQPIRRQLLWAKDEVKKKYNIDVRLVELPADFKFSNYLQEKKPLWDIFAIEGEDFHALKMHGQLMNIGQVLPNAKYLDQNLPIQYDRGEAVEGLEIPWVILQYSFLYNSTFLYNPNTQNNLNNLPRNIHDFLKAAVIHSGFVSYPRADHRCVITDKMWDQLEKALRLKG